MQSVDYQATLTKRIEAQQRQRDREIAKRNDPVWRSQQREKQQASISRTIARQIERRNTPEFKAKQEASAKKRTERAIERAQTKRQSEPKPKAKTRTVTSGRGLKGRTPTVSERTVMDALGKLPCIACHQHGKETVLISLHHINGRTKPGAHLLQIPLCDCHHQHAAPAEVRAEYPWLVPVHADGVTGGKAEFNRHNGTEKELMIKAYTMAGIAHLLEGIGCV